MRGGVLTPALLFAALGLALGCARRRVWAPSLIALFAVLALSAFAPVPGNRSEGIYLAYWASVITTAGSVYFIRTRSLGIALALSLNAGVWLGAVARLSGSPSELIEALPCVLILFPASWAVHRYGSIPVKVVSSWIMAIATLAAVLQLLPVTPGYLPDHLE